MRVQAVILKKIPIREYDELVICYTERAGKQTYQAKSVLKPTSLQAGHLDLLNLVDFSLISGNSHPIITGAHSLRAYFHLKHNLSAMAAGYFLLECFDKMIFDNEPDRRLWDFLTGQLEKYDSLAKENGAFWATAINSSRQKLLEILGYDRSAIIEEIAGGYFKSLQFAQKVIR